MEQALARYEELLTLAKKYQYEYDLGHPTISDKEWDELYWELVALEQQLNLNVPNSLTKTIIYTVKNELDKVHHSHPMLSLDKTKDFKEILKFIEDESCVAMLKMDGLTCSLTYEGGRLVRAETRGNGVIGEDITHNAFVVASIPKTIPCTDRCVIDGEIVCTYQNFEKFNTEYSNPRNFAAGSIRLLNNKECERRGLAFVAWDWIEGSPLEYLSSKLGSLYVMGFTVVPWVIPAFEYGESWADAVEWLKSEAQRLGYPIDGIVFKYDNCLEYEAAGYTEHHFKGGLAYKFYDELYETSLVDIEWSMGRTGVLTPVAILEEIEIDGAFISRASLHNVSVMYELLGQPYVGQKVRVYRANQIIPQIYDAEKSSLSITTLQPSKCPICGDRLKLIDNGGVITLNCPNEECDGKLLNKLDHFCGKKGLDIKGISKATLEKLMTWGWVNSIEDIFNLQEHKTVWTNTEGFGEKSVDKIFAAIDAAKQTDLASFISSLGIPLIGKAVAKDLAKVFDTYEDFREAVAAGYEFWQLPNFGEAKHNAIINFDYTSADKVRTYLSITNSTNEEKIQALAGLVFVCTGKLTHHKNRAELKDLIERHGGKLTDSISAKTNYLINNDITSSSSKNKTAKIMGIPIITEQQFLDFLSGQR